MSRRRGRRSRRKSIPEKARTFGDADRDQKWEEDGILEREDLNRMLEQIGDADMEETLWELMDKNDDGKISAGEFAYALNVAFDTGAKRILRDWKFWVLSSTTLIRFLKVVHEGGLKVKFLNHRRFMSMWKLLQFLESFVMLCFLMQAIDQEHVQQRTVLQLLAHARRFRAHWQGTYKLRFPDVEQDNEQDQEAEE